MVVLGIPMSMATDTRVVNVFPSHGYGLQGDALTVGRALLKRFPFVVITRGRSSLEEQAAAMAANECTRRDEWLEKAKAAAMSGAKPERHRPWIENTYLDSPPKRALVEWSERHPKAMKGEMAAAFVGIMRTFRDAELGLLTRHLSGEALDVRPMLDQIQVAEWLRAEAVRLGGKFLETEAGLIRWHWQAGRRR